MTPDISSLPAISADVSRAVTWLARMRWSLDLPIYKADRGPIRLEVIFGQSPVLLESVTKIHVTSSFASFDLYAEKALVVTLAALLFFEWFGGNGRSLPVDWLAILVLDRLTYLCGMEADIFQLESAGSTDPSHGEKCGTLHGLVCIDGVLHPFEVSIRDVSGSFPDRLQLLEYSLMSNGVDPGFPCSFYLPAKKITSPNYERLRLGDVVLITGERNGSIPFRGCIPGVLNFSGTLSTVAGGTSSRSVIESMGRSNMTSDHDLSGSTPNDYPGEECKPLSAESLPVTLQISLGRHRMTLGELQHLAPGSTLEFDIDLSAPVDITANGTPVGRGNLIRIGDHVGVQLAEWPIMKVTWDA